MLKAGLLSLFSLIPGLFVPVLPDSWAIIDRFMLKSAIIDRFMLKSAIIDLPERLGWRVIPS